MSKWTLFLNELCFAGGEYYEGRRIRDRVIAPMDHSVCGYQSLINIWSPFQTTPKKSEYLNIWKNDIIDAGPSPVRHMVIRIFFMSINIRVYQLQRCGSALKTIKKGYPVPESFSRGDEILLLPDFLSPLSSFQLKKTGGVSCTWRSLRMPDWDRDTWISSR